MKDYADAQLFPHYRISNKIKVCPVYIKEVKAINDEVLAVTYIDSNKQIQTKNYASFTNATREDTYCRFGSGSNKLYEGYTGPLLITNVSDEQLECISKVVKEYGSAIRKRGEKY